MRACKIITTAVNSKRSCNNTVPGIGSFYKKKVGCHGLNPKKSDTILACSQNKGATVVLLDDVGRERGEYGRDVIFSLIDQAGFVEARNHGQHRWVTAAIDRIEFKRAVHVGDIVSLFTTTIRKGTTSITVGVEVEAQRTNGDCVAVTSAALTMVAVDAKGKPIPFRSAPSV